jgi:hypothetical protein
MSFRPTLALTQHFSSEIKRPGHKAYHSLPRKRGSINPFPPPICVHGIVLSWEKGRFYLLYVIYGKITLKTVTSSPNLPCVVYKYTILRVPCICNHVNIYVNIGIYNYLHRRIVCNKLNVNILNVHTGKWLQTQTDKWQTRPLVREGAPQRQDSNPRTGCNVTWLLDFDNYVSTICEARAQLKATIHISWFPSMEQFLCYVLAIVRRRSRYETCQSCTFTASVAVLPVGIGFIIPPVVRLDQRLKRDTGMSGEIASIKGCSYWNVKERKLCPFLLSFDYYIPWRVVFQLVTWNLIKICHPLADLEFIRMESSTRSNGLGSIGNKIFMNQVPVRKVKIPLWVQGEFCFLF